MELRRVIQDASTVFEYLKAEDRVRNIREGFTANSQRSTLTNQAEGVYLFLRNLDFQQTALMTTLADGENPAA